VLRSEHTAQEFVKIDEWTRPAGISRYGNIGPKIDWATSPATYRGTIRKSPDTGPGSVDGGVPVFCHWSLRPRFAFNHAATRGSAAEHLGPCLRRSAMTFAMSAASVSVRWCCAPSAMTSAARATRFPRRTRCSRRSCHSTEAAMRTRPAQKAGTPRPEKLERAEPDLIANPDRVQAHFVMAERRGGERRA
jgi:hypothetical protein